MLNFGILYLWLYYRPAVRELSRNFLADPSRRQVELAIHELEY